MPVLILIDVVLIPLMLVALGLGLVVRCHVQRLQRWPGVEVSHDLGWWRRRSVTSLSKSESNLSSVGVVVSSFGAVWATQGYGWGWVMPATFVLIVVTNTAPALIHNWTVAARSRAR